ncbi:MAG: sialate O-acetylesterase [Planctomycetota bacterium]
MKVLLLAGQSNMEGSGRSADLDRAALPRTVRIFTDTGWVGIDQLRERFGPEIGVAEVLAERGEAEQTALIKHAVGGTSSLAWEPDWDPREAARTDNADAGPLYRQLLDRVGAAREHDPIDPVGVLWMQGESDARHPEVAPAYANTMRRIIDAWRNDLARPDLPVVMGLVDPPANAFPAAELVQAAQRLLAENDAHIALVDTTDLSKWSDALHYDSAGVRELGRRLATAWFDLRPR